MGGLQVRAPGNTVPFCKQHNMKGHEYNYELSLTSALVKDSYPISATSWQCLYCSTANVAEGWPTKLLSRGWCQPLQIICDLLESLSGICVAKSSFCERGLLQIVTSGDISRTKRNSCSSAHLTEPPSFCSVPVNCEAHQQTVGLNYDLFQ